MPRQSVEHQLYSVADHPRWRTSFPEKVANQQGILPVFIHPFFHQYDEYPKRGIKKRIMAMVESGGGLARQIEPEKKRSALTESGYLWRLRQYLATTDAELLLLGEYGPELDLTVKLFRKMGYRRMILTYETEDGDPRPEEGTWREVAEAINLLRATTVVVAGQLLGLYRHNDGEVDVSGCVPDFCRQVPANLRPKDRPRILLSPITYPNWQIISRDKPVFPLKK